MKFTSVLFKIDLSLFQMHECFVASKQQINCRFCYQMEFLQWKKENKKT